MAQQSALEPPAYTPATPVSSHRTIQDLRAQIIANASVIRPRTDVNKSSDDHIELVVAKTPPPRTSPANTTTTHWDEKNGNTAFNRRPAPGRQYIAAATSSSSVAARQPQFFYPPPEGEKHYAVLVRRSGNTRSISVISMLTCPFPRHASIGKDQLTSKCSVQGEPRDSVEDALEWMLERTEMMMHDLIVKTGRPDSGDGCVVM